MSRDQRTVIARRVAADFDGIAHRRDLRSAGVSRHDVRSEVAAGRWHTLGNHTVVIAAGRLSARALAWHAIWESGSGAVLDGVAALQASGMTNFQLDGIDIALPKNSNRHRHAGIRLHQYRVMPRVIRGGMPRVAPELAVLHAAQWAATDRMAALLIVLVIQQRIVSEARLLEALKSLRRCRRRRVLEGIVRDVCDGAHALSELDFTRLCRRYGLPPPSRQVVREAANGRVYLDVEWEEIGLVVEIDGAHHRMALNAVMDALRQNDVVLTDRTVLRIPALGLRVNERAFMTQVAQAHTQLSARRVG